MSYLAREEQRDCGVPQVRRTGGVDTKKITRMIQRHKNHNHAAQEIDGFDAEPGRWRYRYSLAGVEFSQVSASVAISSPNEDICSGRLAFLSAEPLLASSQCAKIEPPISLMK